MVVPTTSNVSNPQQWGFDARLGDNLLRLVSNEESPGVQITRQPSQVPTVSTAVNPEDFTDEVGRTYSQTSLEGGSGLRYAHRRDNPSDAPSSYWFSKGLEINTNGDVNMVNTMEEIIAPPVSAFSPVERAAYDGTDLWVTTGGTDLTRITNLTDSSPTTASVSTGASNDIEDVVSLGGTIYAATGSQVLWNDTGVTTFTQWSDSNIVRLWRAKNRIIASDGVSLYEDPEGTGSKTPLVTLSSGDEWTGVVDAGQFVLAESRFGVIYALSFDGTNLSLSGQTTFAQEECVGIGALYGKVFVLTRQEDGDGFVARFWVGDLGTDGVLENLSVEREWFDLTEEEVPENISLTERDSVFFGLSDKLYSDDLDIWTYRLGTGRLSTTLFIDGITGTSATEIIKAGGRFWIFTAEGGVYRESTTTVESATLIGPLVDFFTANEKVWKSLRVSGDYTGGGTITAYFTEDPSALDSPMGAGWTGLKVFRNDTDLATPIVAAESRYLAVRLDFSGNPALRSYALRALPPLSDEEITLTINISDTISRPGREPTRVAGYGDDIYTALRALEGQALELEIFSLDKKWRGAVLQVATPIQTSYRRGGVTRFTQVVFRGLERPTTNPLLTNTLFGATQWGRGLFGRSEVTL